VLSTNYTPEEPVGRDTELTRIAEATRPLVRNQPADNLLVYGPAGVGKTTCVEHVFDTLSDQGRVRTVVINCWQYNTRPSLLTELLVQLGYPAPRKGKPVDELLTKLGEWLTKNRSVVLTLDEFDQLEDASEIIYDLELVTGEAANHLGLVMISNRHPSKLYLDPQSRSRLNCQTLQFNPYSTEQLIDVLDHRAFVFG